MSADGAVATVAAGAVGAAGASPSRRTNENERDRLTLARQVVSLMMNS